MSKVKDSNGKEFTVHSVSKEDYPELEGKIIKYYDGQSWLHAVVVGVNRSVGVTIVNAEDRTENFVCTRGPVAPKPHRFGPENGKACTYDEYFDYMVDAIKSGKVNGQENYVKRNGHEPWGSCSAGMCAFSQ